jgi:hypothetical protein
MTKNASFFQTKGSSKIYAIKAVNIIRKFLKFLTEIKDAIIDKKD